MCVYYRYHECHHYVLIIIAYTHIQHILANNFSYRQVFKAPAVPAAPAASVLLTFPCLPWWCHRSSPWVSRLKSSNDLDELWYSMT